MPYNKSFIDQASSVKMAEYWPRSLFAILWTSTSSRSIKTQKENSANIALGQYNNRVYVRGHKYVLGPTLTHFSPSRQALNEINTVVGSHWKVPLVFSDFYLTLSSKLRSNLA